MDDTWKRWAALLVATGAAMAFAALGGCGDDVTPAPEDLGEYGSVGNDEEFGNAPQALPVAALRDPPLPLTLPASVTLTNLPAIAQQGTPPNANGSPGTCEAQSFAYGLGSYTAARAPDGSHKWTAADAANEVSAAYQFALAVNNGFATCPKGGTATQYLGRLASFGSPSTADVPYQPSCTYFSQIDLNKPYPNAPRLRIGSFATFRVDNPGAFNRIQEYLANQQAVAFSGQVYKGYGNLSGPTLTDGYFYAGNTPYQGGHGQLLVGYDDNLGAPGLAKGMFLVQNSFGTQWPSSESKAPRGMLYWSYETFMKNQELAAVAYPHDPSPPSGTPLAKSDSRAPVGSIARAYQWAPEANGAVWLILIHHLAEPVRITAVALKEPAPGTAQAVGKYGQFLSKGYTYLRRTDGKAFLPGNYQLTFQAQTLDGLAVTYTGTIAVGTPQPNAPAAASMAATAAVPPNGQQQLFDSVGQSALLTL